MRYRRLLLTVVMTALMLVPAGVASATAECPTIEGTAMYNFGDNVGFANVSLDGEDLRVPFFAFDFVPTGENTADIFFVWLFPEGDVILVEHSETTPKGGPAAEFNSTIEVLDEGYGHWTWTGTANGASGRAAITHISGELCVGGEV